MVARFFGRPFGPETGGPKGGGGFCSLRAVKKGPQSLVSPFPAWIGRWALGDLFHMEQSLRAAFIGMSKPRLIFKNRSLSLSLATQPCQSSGIMMHLIFPHSSNYIEESTETRREVVGGSKVEVGQNSAKQVQV